MGIGGYSIPGHSSSAVMQAGIASFVSSSGSVSVYPWWEIYPFNNEQPITSLAINAGDQVYVDVSYSPANGGTFSWYIQDNNTGKSIPVQKQTGISGYYDGTEAEWVVERPKVNGSIISLSDFYNNPIAFSSCSTNNSNNQRNGLADSTDYQVNKLILTSDGSPTGKILAAPSSITTSTVGYTDYWHASS